jgi:hypothetical protein
MGIGAPQRAATTGATGVFISYRRGETSGQARALNEQLGLRFGEQRIFMDVDSIMPGADFVEKIDEAVKNCGVVLALIGHDWARRPGADKFLLEDEDDFVRRELTSALDQGVPVIPILVERTPMPSAECVPERLRPLLRRNALELENARWDADVERLMRAIEAHVALREQEQPPPTARWWKRPLVILPGLGLIAAVAVIAVLLAGGGKSSTVIPSAASQASKANPARLAAALLGAPMRPSELPRGMLQSFASLVPQYSTSAGVVADLNYVFSGPDLDDWGYYMVFSDSASAQAFYSGGQSPYPGPSDLTGSFTDNQLSDTTRCVRWRTRSSGRIASECEVLSGSVISFGDAVAGPGSNGNDVNARVLVAALVGHLGRIAQRVASSPAPQNRISAQALSNALLTDTLQPSEVPNPYNVGKTYRLTAAAAPGLLRAIETDFTENGSSNTASEQYFVFDTPTDAASWYGTNGRHLNGGHITSTFSLSGFPERTDCNTYVFSTSPPNVATCYSLSGNVVTQGYAAWAGTAASSTVAAVFDRAALVRLMRIRTQGS